MNDCIFCKIVSGDIPSFKIYETGETLAFLDIAPMSRGHVLVIPKKHSPNIFEISSEDWSNVQETVRVVAIGLEKATAADGVNLLMNNREHAWQIVHHVHVHLIPRFKNDGIKLTWPRKKYRDGEADDLREKIRSALDI